MKWIFLLVIVLFSVSSCKSRKKKKEPETKFFALIPFLRSQVAAMDTSINPIIAITTTDSGTDTVDVHRADFKQYAIDFLSIPDISSEETKENYTESVMYDEPTNSILLNYTPINSDEDIRRETIILDSDEKGEGEVKTVIIDWFRESKDSVVIKNMIWQVDKSFQVITKTTPANQQEKIRILEVKWE